MFLVVSALLLSGSAAVLSMPQQLNPAPDFSAILNLYANTMNRLCQGEPPAKCLCEFGVVSSIVGPITADQFSLCRPSQCSCPDGSMVTAPTFESFESSGPPSGPIPGGLPPQIVAAMQAFLQTLTTSCPEATEPTSCSCPGTILEPEWTMEKFADCRPETCTCADGTTFVPEIPDVEALASQVKKEFEADPGAVFTGGVPPPPKQVFEMLISNTLYEQVSKLCGEDQQPESCSCTGDELPLDAVPGPFSTDMAAMLFLCKPDTCSCGGEDVAVGEVAQPEEVFVIEEKEEDDEDYSYEDESTLPAEFIRDGPTDEEAKKEEEETSERQEEDNDDDENDASEEKEEDESNSEDKDKEEEEDESGSEEKEEESDSKEEDEENADDGDGSGDEEDGAEPGTDTEDGEDDDDDDNQ